MNKINFDRKALLNRIEELKECSKVKQVEYEIDNEIVLPDWVQERISDRICGCLTREGIEKAESIFNFCNCVIASIEPFSAEKCICLIERKGDSLKIRFTLRHLENENF